MSIIRQSIARIRCPNTLQPCQTTPQCCSTLSRRFGNYPPARSPDVQVEPPQPSSPPPPPTAENSAQPSTPSETGPEESKTTPVSRRRQQAIKSTQNIPFEQLPYQCFQEARKVLKEDRDEKLQLISQQRERIAKLREQKVDDAQRGQHEHKIKSMLRQLEELKILADINDPLVKRTFEDGNGDMNKPIYRYLADRKWRAQQRLIIMQRVHQMSLIPDVLAKIDPTYEVSLSFSQKKIQPGVFVPSHLSAERPILTIQPFNSGQRLVSIAIIDADVPNLEKDGFEVRCHYLAANIPVSPTNTQVSLELDPGTKDSQLILDWVPPFAQKGSPYHRLGTFILEQPDNEAIDVKSLTAQDQSGNVQYHGFNLKRDGFNLRSFVGNYKLTPVGVHMFRTQWDDGTAEVMSKFGIAGADVEFVRKKIPPLPYKKKDGKRYR